MNSATVDAAVAAFLKAELDSPTEAPRVRAALRSLSADEQMVVNPDLDDHRANATRWQLFQRYRGGETLFDSLDLRALTWYRAQLTESDLRARISTCRHNFQRTWGSRDPVLIAQQLNTRGQPNGVLERIRAGVVLEPPLLVSTPALERLVILEGHNRIIAYLRDLDDVPLPLAAFVGVSDAVASWREW